MATWTCCATAAEPITLESGVIRWAYMLVLDSRHHSFPLATARTDGLFAAAFLADLRPNDNPAANLPGTVGSGMATLDLPSRPGFARQTQDWQTIPTQLAEGGKSGHRPASQWLRCELLALVAAVMVATLAFVLLLAIRQNHRRRQAEQVARDREEHYRQLIDLAVDGIILGDHRGIVTEVNRQMCALTGMERDQFLGRAVGELSFMQEPLATAPHWATLPAGETLVLQCHLTRPDGTESVLEMHSKRMPDGSCQAIFRDIGDQLRAHAAQLESERKFALTFSASPDVITLNRCSDYCYTEVNPGFTRLTGYSREEAFGKQPRELGIWHDPADGHRLMQLLQRDGQYDNIETLYRHRNGSTGTVLLSARIIQLDSVPHILTIARDITILKRSEEEILAQKRLFETMFNAMPDAIIITGTDGLIQMTNVAAEVLFGYPGQELRGLSIAPLLTEAPWPLAASPWEAEPQESTEPFIRTYYNSLGHSFPGETLLAPMLDSANNPIGHIGIIRDISKRQRDEANLRQLKMAIEHADEVVIITDHRGRIQYLNPAFERSTGYSVTEAFRQGTRILQSDQHDRAFYRDLWRTITNGRVWQGRFINRRKNGSLFTEETTISPVFADQGYISHYVAIKRDITDQLRLESQYLQAQKMESVGRLTGGVAHDFNNILSVIIGYTGMAMRKVDPASDLHAYLDTILDSAERSVGIVKQLLAFSRNQAITPKALNLNETVEDTLNMLRHLVGEEIELRWIPRAGLPPVLMDPTQVSQILVNLSVNARDAIDGAGIVTIETMRTSCTATGIEEVAAGPREYVLLRVSDTGCGAPPEVLEHIFEPFFTTKGAQGTGLGLATVYGIVKQNNGFIDVTSKPGRGSVFRIALPVHAGPLAQPPGQPATRLQRGDGETILVVDNDAQILELIEVMLRNLGYKTLSASSPEDALRMQEEYHDSVDLLLTDVVMPKKNGVQLATVLSQRQTDLRVLYMSGHAADAIAHHGVMEGNVPFLRKPLTLESLAVKLREVLDHPRGAE